MTCHVGTPDANVDHDMIAAGHPPLRFEFSSYLANLPPHWDVAKDRQKNSPGGETLFEPLAWVTGQNISSAAAAELLAFSCDPKRQASRGRSSRRWLAFRAITICAGKPQSRIANFEVQTGIFGLE